MLARVLAEVDLGSLGEELISLARDKSAEVRACAARGLPKLHPSIALPLLIDLLEDSSWFVRLRAVVSIGSMELPETVGPLVRMLQDSNRLVRQRAAAALVRRSDHLRSIIRETVALRDRYGLQALLSELERSGACDPMLLGLRSDPRLASAIDAAREDMKLGQASDTQVRR
jgi:HEAT repeat protein